MYENSQLFRIKPDKEFVLTYLKLFIPYGFDNEYYKFSRYDIKRKRVIDTMKNEYFTTNFIKMYLPCKYKKYFTNITEKRTITILRQLLKMYDYNIITSEKYKNKKKYLTYNLKNMKKKEKEVNNKKMILYFD